MSLSISMPLSETDSSNAYCAAAHGAGESHSRAGGDDSDGCAGAGFMNVFTECSLVDTSSQKAGRLTEMMTTAGHMWFRGHHCVASQIQFTM